jgi:hypothetical protein
MSEPINLRTVRKRAKRQQDDEHARANRLAYGQPKAAHQRAGAERANAIRRLDGHRLEPGDDR